MQATQLLPVFLVGLAGSVHCAGMCGGIVGALSAASPAQPLARASNVRAISPAGPPAHASDAAVASSAQPAADASKAPAASLLPVARIDSASAGRTVRDAPAGIASSSAQSLAPTSVGNMPRRRATIAIVPVRDASRLLRIAAYNSGRIGSYMIAGALAGGLAGGAAQLAWLASLQLLLYWLANLMLVALGLYLMDAWHGLTRLEALGQLPWRRLLPLLQWLLPMDSTLKALALGGVWGWVPCGMVYSVLLTALLSGSAAGGAAVMLAFGLGTLPMLLGLGLVGARLRQALQRPGVRRACGLLVLGFGMLGLARASLGMSFGWLDSLCLTTHS